MTQCHMWEKRVFHKVDNVFQFNQVPNVLIGCRCFYWGQYTYQKMHLIVIYPWHIFLAQSGVCSIIFSCGGKRVCCFGQKVFAQRIHLMYHEKLIIFVPPFGIIIFLLCKNIFHSKQCYHHFEIVIYGIFHPKKCKKLFRTIFFSHPKGLSLDHHIHI